MNGGWGTDSRKRISVFTGIFRLFCLLVQNCSSRRTFTDLEVVKELSSTTFAVQYL